MSEQKDPQKFIKAAASGDICTAIENCEFSHYLQNPEEALTELKLCLELYGNFTSNEYTSIMNNMKMWIETYDDSACAFCKKKPYHYLYVTCCRVACCYNCVRTKCPKCNKSLTSRERISIQKKK